MRYVGHPQIRARGTVCGSAAHADPAAELPVALTALDARFHVRSLRGLRRSSAEQLFLGFLTTSLEPDELLVEIEVPVPPAGGGSAFVEHARTPWRLRPRGAAAVVGGGEARLALLAAGPVPMRAREAEAAMAAGASFAEAAEAAVAGLELTGEDADWRRALLRSLARRALEEAAA